MDGLPRISQSKHGYSELLYAHLLDGEGQRLTYTHFTAKVNTETSLSLSRVLIGRGQTMLGSHWSRAS